MTCRTSAPPWEELRAREGPGTCTERHVEIATRGNPCGTATANDRMNIATLQQRLSMRMPACAVAIAPLCDRPRLLRLPEAHLAEVFLVSDAMNCIKKRTDSARIYKTNGS